MPRLAAIDPIFFLLAPESQNRFHTTISSALHWRQLPREACSAHMAKITEQMCYKNNY